MQLNKMQFIEKIRPFVKNFLLLIDKEKIQVEKGIVLSLFSGELDLDSRYQFGIYYTLNFYPESFNYLPNNISNLTFSSVACKKNNIWASLPDTETLSDSWQAIFAYYRLDLKDKTTYFMHVRINNRTFSIDFSSDSDIGITELY